MKIRSLFVALIGLSLSAPSAAMADTLTKTDPAGDVAKFEETGMTVVPEQTNGDILRTVTTHGPAKVKVRIKLVDLAKEGTILAYVAVKSNKGRSGYRGIEVLAAPGGYAGKVTVTRANDTVVKCRTTRTLDYTANTIQLDIPRSCLGSPRWVRVGTAVLAMADGIESLMLDDARGNGTTGTTDPYFSTKIFR